MNPARIAVCLRTSAKISKITIRVGLRPPEGPKGQKIENFGVGPGWSGEGLGIISEQLQRIFEEF